jgi:hypothetical protein
MSHDVEALAGALLHCTSHEQKGLGFRVEPLLLTIGGIVSG